MFSLTGMRQSFRQLDSDCDNVSIIQDDSENDKCDGSIITARLPAHATTCEWDVVINKMDKDCNFLQLIKENERIYQQAASKAEKHAIAHSIYKLVSSHGGRFLEQVGCTTTTVSPTKALIKINQTLRTASRKGGRSTTLLIELRKSRSKSLFSPELAQLQESMQAWSRSRSDPCLKSGDDAIIMDEEVPLPMPSLSRQLHVVSEEFSFNA
mmetsp:Transcript_19799/g.47119  ORF Transcript_19799/g.47119 Transcript_19799/m.47119 type:complete len:211 (+) Transcript_19799:244-876(+)